MWGLPARQGQVWAVLARYLHFRFSAQVQSELCELCLGDEWVVVMSIGGGWWWPVTDKHVSELLTHI